ncbi:hypothetical protein ACT3XG_14715 [Paenibacillus polymyxa]|uniref:hypothetical protein n=1 Tax=Paenibacillus TaxID=44249 RepID=UPI00142DC71A|nr:MULTISPECIES: hypothetical protein [Paenibacillus]KAF6658879.1 hypothetical protein HFD99_01295 [Paenibacillus sp. EKM301P]UBS85410.1 hypothetical protein LAZ93_14680 [Paenibacillus polymyxa]WHX33927.1 hypothetical protein QNH38_15150 [Paenibacillus polymyxa]
MKLLTIGYFTGWNSNVVDFGSSTSFLDYDVVLIDLSSVLDEYDAEAMSPTFQGLKRISDHHSAKLKADIDRRKHEITELLNLGRTVVVYTPFPIHCYVDSGKREYSGTGKNQKKTTIVNLLDVRSILPIYPETMLASGSNLEFIGESAFKPLTKHKDKLRYNAYFTKPLGNPIFKIKGTKNIVSSYINTGTGTLLFIPELFNPDDDVDEGVEEEIESQFFNTLTAIITDLKKEDGDFQLPSWSIDYTLPGEFELKQQLLEYEKEMKMIADKISKQKEELLKLEEYKLLFTATGRSLEVQVGKVFIELGFEVEEGLPGRDDLILKYNDQIAVVEVKGVSKSAAEKHAAQLEKWVSEYFVSKGINPKGILIVNAFKDKPLSERTESPFPAQMMPYCESRNHCLLTSTDLLSIFLSVKKDPNKKEEIIQKIFDTSGVYEGNSWKESIKAPEAAVIS